MRPIDCHAAIGDGRSVALVADDGAIDWLSWPRCDSDAVFASLLDDAAGHLRIAPTAPFTAMPLMPALHPRMASLERPPTDTRTLEPPGFLALHYGIPTPISVILAHVVYGAVLGLFATMTK